MASIIKIKNSKIADKKPIPTNLEVGELAINITDKKIYTKNSSNNVVHLFPDNVLLNGYQEQSIDLGTTGPKTIDINGKLYQFNEILTNDTTITIGNKPTKPICASSVIYIKPGGHNVTINGVDLWAGGVKPITSASITLMRFVISTTPIGDVLADFEIFKT
jgi:hypothetical protein